MTDLIRSILANATRWSTTSRFWVRNNTQAAAAAAKGMGAAGAATTGLALVTIALVLAQGGWGFIRENVIGAVPSEVRELPGVRAVVGVVTPTYNDSVFGLRAPLSVAVTPDGQFLYVAEGTGLRQVRKIRLSDGEAVAELVPPQTTPAKRAPVSVTVVPNGLVYVVDRLRNEVDIYDPVGNWLGLLPRPAAGPWEPLSVDSDENGYLYVTNTAPVGPLLAIYSPDEAVIERYAAVRAAGVVVTYASGVAIGRDGRIWISDSNNGRLVVLERGELEGIAYGSGPGDSSMALPRGIVIDRHGYAIVADANDHSVAGWDLNDGSEELLYRFGVPGIEDGAFLFPSDIAIDSSGTLYVADRDNDRVQIWSD